MPTPIELGLPEKFGQWRAKQDDAVIRAYDSPKRFVALALPTGAGKSAVYVALAKLVGKRAAILTSTKALQAQLADDFQPSGLVDIRGANNYDCLESHGAPDRKVRSCDHGYCHSGRKCELMKSGCLYYDRVKDARNGELVSTNYAYWLAKQMELDQLDEQGLDAGGTARVKGLGKFDLLVLDEAHDAVDELCQFLGARIPRADVRLYCATDFPETDNLETWRAWAGTNAEMLREKINVLKAEIRMGVVAWYKEMWKVRAMERLMQENAKVAGMQGQWLMEVTRQGSSGEKVAVFDPVWPGPYAEAALFRGIRKVVFTSATVTRKTIELLGVPESEIDFAEYPSTFPKEHRPIISVPGVRVDNKADQSLLKVWVSKIDAIIDKRLDRKGIIHTVSYARAEFIAKWSRHRDIMLLHETRTARHVVEVFKDSPAPLVLVSPSMTTGWDFPYCLAPTTRVLRADLHWVEVQSLKPGDNLLAFDEFAVPGRRERRWRKTEVVEARTIELPAYRTILNDGTEFVSSADHRWLTTYAQGGQRWTATEELRFRGKLKSKFVRLLPVWSERSSRENGYLAAAFDGEGSLHQRTLDDGDAANALCFTQNTNEMLSRVMFLLDQKGFRYNLYQKTENQFVVRISDRANLLRFLGEIRPYRLLPKFSIESLGAIAGIERPEVVWREPVGKCSLTALSTSTGTIVAEGFASHNSACFYQIIGKVPFPDTRNRIVAERTKQDPTYGMYLAMQQLVQASGRGMRAQDDVCETIVVDDHFKWFIGKNKKFAPRWFLDAVVFSNVIPKPLEVQK